MRLLGLFILLFAAAIGSGCNGCNSRNAKLPEAKQKPTLRLYALGGAAGAIEPCGCVKDMLGGVDHAAAYVSKQARTLPGQLVVGAGPMLFSDPAIEPERRAQAEFKARALAESFKDMGLRAWAPGVNDWALGSDQLAALGQASGASLLAANLAAPTVPVKSTVLERVNDTSVGITGVVVTTPRQELPDGAGFDQALGALRASLARLNEQGAQLKIALIAAPRGEALRLVERVEGFQVLVVGKAVEEGDHNDDPVAPTIVGQTLVVQAPNHLQGLAVVDLFVDKDDFSFEGASDIERLARRESVERRIGEIEGRLAEGKQSGARAQDLKALEKDLQELKSEGARLQTAGSPPEGSFYRYELIDVRESLGVDNQVKKRLVAYYKRVNQHNKQVFKDKLPPPVSEGEASYLGAEKCGACHMEEHAFWMTTRHFNAYETLEADHKEFNLDCVGCHVTGYEKPGGSTVTHVEGLTDVQCEVCHGPGSLHVANPAELSLIQGKPDQGLCADTCHHPPHVHKGWNVAQAWQKILGPGHGR